MHTLQKPQSNKNNKKMDGVKISIKLHLNFRFAISREILNFQSFPARSNSENINDSTEGKKTTNSTSLRI